MTKRNPMFHGGKSTASKHAERIARDAKHREQRERYLDRDGKFTVRHSKGER